jgi:hypothetical protein
MSTLTPTPAPAPTRVPDTFDTSTALAGLMLWLLFGFFTSLLGCDLQRLVSQNMYVKHFLALVSFFFLFTILDPSNKAGIDRVWLKTVAVYLLFVASTKSKAWASIAVVVLLILDQTIKMQANYISHSEDPEKDAKLARYNRWRKMLYAIIVVIIVTGFVHYLKYQYDEYGKDFDLATFLLGTVKCREM